MKVTTKGQVTIPLEFRKEFGLFPHVEVEFKVSSGGILSIQKSSSQLRGSRLIEKMRGKSNVSMSTDEIMQLTRD